MKASAISKPYYSQTGFDRYVCDIQNQIFGVFDGMGIDPGALKAADYCAREFAALPKEYYNFEGLEKFINLATNHFKYNGEFGGTTATVVYIDKSGFLHYAHAGDSRLYILLNGRIKQITADEGYENILYNYVGRHGKGVSQLGYIEEWDKFMLCTDGITGDRPPELLSDEDIEACLAGNNEPEFDANVLVKSSKKKDDKTVIVGVR